MYKSVTRGSVRDKVCNWHFWCCRNFWLLVALPFLSTFPIACGVIDYEIDAVYYAQTHVHRADHPYFRLVSNRPALIKVELHHQMDSIIPVIEVVRANRPDEPIRFDEPKILSTELLNQPDALEEHSFDYAFSTVLPADWVQPGVELVITINGLERWRASPTVGAPNPLIMNMFDTHFFALDGKTYPENWKTELEAKLPISALNVRKVENILFKELVIPKRAGLPPVRVSSRGEYQALTGQSFDGEQAAALQWVNALHAAAGLSRRWSLYYVNIHGVAAGGQAGGFKGVGYGSAHGVLLHELGHALSLPHWQQNMTFPYRGDMLGVKAPAENSVHAGPTWAFDLNKNAFIKPYLDTVSGKVFKRDPMAGGGNNREDDAYLYRHFADYSVFRMQNWLENNMVRWDNVRSTWQSWDIENSRYRDIEKQSVRGFDYGTFLPNQPNDSVISIMAAISGKYDKGMDKNGAEHINMVYPPIGPYPAGLIPTFDPTLREDRASMNALKYCPDTGCDLTFRVLQGGVVSYYAIAQSFSSSLANDITAFPELATKALNIEASRGEVTLVELLDTPDANLVGVPAEPRILARWVKES